MMATTSLIEQLIESLRCLPGVGPKSAQRMAYHLLERDRDGATRLAGALTTAARDVTRCSQCRTFCDSTTCDHCADPRRDGATICVVESPMDILSIEHSAGYRGHYFVLMGHLSPLDGIGPQEIGLDLLAKRIREGTVKEVILATSTTLEGEATAHYISEMVRELGCRASRIAYGVPFGGELEYVDGATLSHAIAGRKEV